MASQTTSVRFDKLTEHNHSSWKFQIKAYLGTKRLRDFLTRTPPISDDEEILANADQALCELQMSVSNSMIHVIRDCVTAKDAFEAIQAYFDSKTSASAAALSQEMSNLEMRPRESITTYFARAERCRDLLTEVGYPMNHKSFQMQLLNGLSKEYESVRTTYLVSPDPNCDNPTTGLMLLRTRLQGVEVSLQSTSSKPAPKALQADAKTCSHCGHPGHVVRECRTLARERAAARKKKQDQDGGKDSGNKTRPKCNWCGQPGHIEARCFAKRDGAAKTAGAGKGSQDGDGDAGKRAPVAFMATPLRYEEFVDAPKRYDPSDFALLDQVRLPLFDSVGTPDIEYFTDTGGDNAFLEERCYKEGRSYFDDDHVSGRFGYANPPFREAMRALEHYFTCKARDPTNTRSIWILPYDPLRQVVPAHGGHEAAGEVAGRDHAVHAAGPQGPRPAARAQAHAVPRHGAVRPPRRVRRAVGVSVQGAAAHRGAGGSRPLPGAAPAGLRRLQPHDRGPTSAARLQAVRPLNPRQGDFRLPALRAWHWHRQDPASRKQGLG